MQWTHGLKVSGFNPWIPEVFFKVSFLKCNLYRYVKVMGTEFQTRDGTCIRDFIHVTVGGWTT
jgi:UDP-glucose 4-epimerase